MFWITAAPRLALTHLVDLGHEKIAFMKGSAVSADSDTRTDAICEVAAELGIPVHPELMVQLEGDDPTPDLGYPFAKQLLACKHPFTALFAYNDISAIGSIRAFLEAGLRVPDDVSVVGFDDIQNSAYISPPLTTVRQPMRKIGAIAARTLLDQLEGRTEIRPKLGSNQSWSFANPPDGHARDATEDLRLSHRDDKIPIPPAGKWQLRGEFNKAARDWVGVKCKDVVSRSPG